MNSARQRLRKALEFKEVREKGDRLNCGCFVIIINRNNLGYSRFGVIASSKVGNAVKRNRAKRVFREIFRLNQREFSSFCDCVVIVRSNFDSFSFQELQSKFIKACASYNNA